MIKKVEEVHYIIDEVTLEMFKDYSLKIKRKNDSIQTIEFTGISSNESFIINSNKNYTLDIFVKLLLEFSSGVKE